MSTHHIVVDCQINIPTVFLYRDGNLIGGWSNHGGEKHGEIAAEVLRTALPDAIVMPLLPSRMADVEWFKSIPIFGGETLDFTESLKKAIQGTEG